MIHDGPLRWSDTPPPIRELPLDELSGDVNTLCWSIETGGTFYVKSPGVIVRLTAVYRDMTAQEEAEYRQEYGYHTDEQIVDDDGEEIELVVYVRHDETPATDKELEEMVIVTGVSTPCV